MAPPPPPGDKGKKQNIEDQEWYHGFRPRKDAARLVTKQGEFLVRATDTGPTTDIVITAMDDTQKLVNITLRTDGAHWMLASKQGAPPTKHKFDSIVELIAYYRASPISKHLKLSKVIARPEWMLKHDNVHYEEKDKLGAGNFCSVYKGMLKRSSGESMQVAVKISLVAPAANEAENDEAKEARKSMMHEAQLMSFYTHENIIQFCGVACDHPPVLVIMEFCAGGDLLSHLLKHGKKTDDREKMIYLYEASRGMFYLHGKKCVHRDLAARNCLISSKGRIKIADFGLSKLLDEPEAEAGAEGAAAASSNAQVPVRWMAPETLKRPAQYSRHSDIWAFGVMAYEIFSNGIKPWPEDPVKYIATMIRKGNMPKMPEATPPKVEAMVKKMWNMTPDQRPSMRFIAKDLNTIIKESNEAGRYDHSKMTLNKIQGVERKNYFENEDTTEFESDSNASTVDGDNDKVDKSGDKKRVRNSKGPTPRRTSSAKEKRESQDK